MQVHYIENTISSGFAALQLTEIIDFSRPNLIICPNQTESETMLENISFFTPAELGFFCEWDMLPYEKSSPQAQISAARINALNNSGTLVGTLKSFSQYILPPEELQRQVLKLELNQKIVLQDLVATLEDLSYKTVSLVEEPGQTAAHAHVVDVFPINSDQAIRIEINDDQIISLRKFNPTTQRKTSELKEFNILPTKELPNLKSKSVLERINQLKDDDQFLQSRLYDELELYGFKFPGSEQYVSLIQDDCTTLLDYYQKFSDTNIYIINPDKCFTEYQQFEKLLVQRYEKLKKHNYLITPEKLYLKGESLESRLSLSTEATVPRKTYSDNHDIRAISHAEHAPGRHPAEQILTSYIKDQYSIMIVVGSSNRLERLEHIFQNIKDIKVWNDSYSQWINSKTPFALKIGRLSEGFKSSEQKIVLITEDEIFPERSQYVPKTKQATSLKKLLSTLSLLKPNDYIVHEDYGRGIYQGLKTKTVGHQTSEFIQLDYADSKLFLPVQKIGRIQKYTSPSDKPPILDKLGSKKWQATKKKVQKAVNLLAGDLLKLYASRELVKGFEYDQPSNLDQEFADYFPYQETDEQLKAIDDVFNDLTSERLMDRLICGDVGFGKTEIAMRAAFKVASVGKQVALLAPTTLLVEQHYRNFSRRFNPFPINIKPLSRFYSAKENKETVQQLKDGKVDIVIGTHKLLQRNIAFQDLGLLIVDEEQRFGVKQKERLKQYHNKIDILSLTATPIPRTLYMSLINIRDISVISTPPVNRKAIKTVVNNYDQELVKDAVRKELSRQGQVFYLHNQVKDIEIVTNELRELVPEAKIIFAHGQMDEDKLEKIVRQFLAKEYDLLVTTTIIENGIDMPNVNTLIVNRADKFGLAQLYQIRGRVGRGARQAYSYLLVPELKKVTADANERLKALEAIDDLGQGFHLALRDLEIRGSGNILGAEQSGNIILIGYDMYTKLVREAVANLMDQEVTDLIEPEIKIPCTCLIPETYLPEPTERLIAYQRLASQETEAQLNDLYLEFTDRFGKPPQELDDYICLMKIRVILKQFGIQELECKSDRLIFKPAQKNKLKPESLVQLCKLEPETYSISANEVITIKGEISFEDLSVLKVLISESLSRLAA